MELLKENRELDDKGDVLKRIEAPSNGQEMKEFFIPRIMGEKVIFVILNNASLKEETFAERNFRDFREKFWKG